MMSYSLTHLADRTLLQALADLATQDRTTTATLLAHVAEVDERKLYVPAAYDSMYLYCLHELHMSEDVAYKRISAARAARRFPAIFPALADGRLHLSAVVMLVPHLAQETVDELLAVATHQTKAGLELFLAERFPRPDVPATVQAIAPAVLADVPALRQVDAPTLQLAPGRVDPSDLSNMAEHMEPLPSHAKLSPLSRDRFALQCTVSRAAYEKLRYAQELLGHALPSGDVAELIERALDSLVEKLERQKFGKCANPRPQRGAAKGRRIPAQVKRAVWQRDGGRCTYVNNTGKRCEARTRLEFDHVELVARGGEATVGGTRLLCRAHNQHAAECALGRDFMREKRREAQRRAAQRKANAQAKANSEANARANTEAKSRAAEVAASQQEVIPWLRALGCNAETARRAAARCAHIPDAPLEERVKIAVQGLAPACVRRAAPVASRPA